MPPPKVLNLVRKYTTKFPDDDRIWVLRLEIEAESEGKVEDADWRKALQEAIAHFRRSNVGEAPDAIQSWEPSTSPESIME